MKLLPPNPIHYQLSPDWKYVNSGATDLRKTFRKIRERIAADKKKTEPKSRQLRTK